MTRKHLDNSCRKVGPGRSTSGDGGRGHDHESHDRGNHGDDASHDVRSRGDPNDLDGNQRAADLSHRHESRNALDGSGNGRNQWITEADK